MTAFDEGGEEPGEGLLDLAGAASAGDSTEVVGVGEEPLHDLLRIKRLLSSRSPNYLSYFEHIMEDLGFFILVLNC